MAFVLVSISCGSSVLEGSLIAIIAKNVEEDVVGDDTSFRSIRYLTCGPQETEKAIAQGPNVLA